MTKAGVLVSLLLLGGPAFPQASPPFPRVERPPVPCDASGALAVDYRISKQEPAVYISFEGTGAAPDPLNTHFLESGDPGMSRRPGKDYWMRLHNNSVWAISIPTHGMHTGKPPEVVSLPGGSYVFAVADGAEVSVIFGVRREDGRRVPVGPGSDMSWESWLPPGRSLLFSVPKKVLRKDRVVEVSYQYEWENGQSFSYNVEPIHRVEFWSYRLPR